MNRIDGGSVNNRIDGRVGGAIVQAGNVQAVHLHPQAPAAPAIPRQLPPATGAWVDRLNDLDQLTAASRDRSAYASALVVISGPGGVGKSALAVRWLLQQREETADGQLYVDLAATGAHVVPTLLRRLLHALGHAPTAGADTMELTSWWRTLTAARRLALLLDNARDAEQVRPLLPGGDGHLVVVTARRPIPALLSDGARSHPLRRFTPDAAEALLTRLVGADRIRSEPDAARALAARCGYLPLTLCVAASRLAGHPHLSVATAAKQPDEGRSVLDDSYADLPDSTARIYRLLACLPVAVVDVDGAAAALDLSLRDTAFELAALAEARQLEELGEQHGRGVTYRFPDEMRGHAQRAAQAEETDQARVETVRRWLDWMLTTASRAERLLTPAHRVLDRDVLYLPNNPVPVWDEEGAQAWLTAHLEDIDPAVTAAEEHGWDAMVYQLPHACWPLWRSLRPLELMLDLHRRGLAAAQRLGHRSAVREMRTTGVIALRGLERYDEAVEWAEAALILARQDADRRSEAQALHELGLCHRARGEADLAVDALTKAIAIREEIGYPRGVALSRLALGQQALDSGDIDQALDALTRARTGLLEEGDRLDSTRATAFLGRAYAAAKQYNRAEQYLAVAADEFRALGSAPWHTRALEMLGQTAEDQLQHEKARELFALALNIAEAASPRDADRIRQRLATAVAPTTDGT
ncbi:tetratricopeptide repeat protein [Streptomyces rhizosphaericus]|uniref:tetratricopeptide repeat protein n=1 Tax=Streptomyces rhizosphaericus TaxID=114699 RepID=UPI000A394A35|nr:tetratricopeptide repeat protein [Streptomyces rhizosphaericus]